MAADIPKVVKVSAHSNHTEEIKDNIVSQEKHPVEKCKASDHSIHKTSSSKQWQLNRTTIVVHKPNDFGQKVIATESISPSDISTVGMKSINPVDIDY